MVSARVEGQEEDLEEEEALVEVALGVAMVEVADLEVVLGVLDSALAILVLGASVLLFIVSHCWIGCLCSMHSNKYPYFVPRIVPVYRNTGTQRRAKTEGKATERLLHLGTHLIHSY